MRFLLLALIIVFPIAAFAVEPDEALSDPALEARAREISEQLRCMVCQNQSIDDSNAELARDLRLLVRDRLVQGDSDSEVIGYIVSRYGEFVLLKPRLSPHTWLLWGAPVLLIILGAAGVWWLAAHRRPADRPLTAEEEARLDRLLAKSDED